MTENITRQPAGIPAGGQFAPSAHAEPRITLTKLQLPQSAAQQGPVISTTTEDSGTTEVHAMVTTPDLDTQLRSYLRVDEPTAPVSLSCEKVDFYGVEEETYTATCGGKEISFGSLDRLLADVAN